MAWMDVAQPMAPGAPTTKAWFRRKGEQLDAAIDAALFWLWESRRDIGAVAGWLTIGGLAILFLMALGD